MGEHQTQHVELARDIAQRFNHLFSDTFVVPEPLIRQVGARVMGLDDPTRKMSKSAEGQNHSVGLLDEPKAIRKKLGRAVTDSGREIRFDPERPGVHNLLGIYQALSGESREQIESRFDSKGYGDLKGEVADALIAELEPIQARYRELEADPGYVDGVLAESVERLQPIVEETMSRARRAMGFS